MKEAIPGSPTYWEQQREGFSLIRQYRRALANAESEPTHYGSNMQESGEYAEIHDNLGPWDAVDRAQAELVAHPAARRILGAHNFTSDEFAIRNKKGMYVRARDIPIFGDKK